MKRLLPPVLLAFFIAVIGLWFVTNSSTLFAPPYANQDGMRGKVEQVLVETAPLVDRFGDWVEAASSFDTNTTYNERGNIIWLDRYRSDNKLEYRIRYTYKDGLLLEETSFDGDDDPLYKWVYTYDDAGNRLSSTGYSEGGKLNFTTNYRYDDQSRLVEETSYHADESLNYAAEQSYERDGYTRESRYFDSSGELSYRTIDLFDTADNHIQETAYGPDETLQYEVSYRYNNGGNLIEETATGPEDGLQYRLENRYDAQDNLIATTEFGPDNKPFYVYRFEHDRYGNITERSSQRGDAAPRILRYEYSYDKQGNWTERRTLKLVTRFDEEVFEPTQVTRRTIKYY